MSKEKLDDLEIIDPAESSENPELLYKAFEAFNEATLKLQNYYRGLEERVHELNDELSIKNQELEQNLIERDRVKNYLSNIFESTTIGMIITDLDGIITSANHIGCKLMESRLQDIRGVHLNEVFKMAILPKDLSLEKLEAYKTAKEQDLDFYGPDGIKKRLLISISLIYSEHRDILGLIINLQNITELKHLEAQAERKSRFMVMGEMAATIAHEIRNPLGSIELFTSLLKKELDPKASHQKLIEHISSAINSMNHIISNLLEYTKPRPVSWEPIDLHAFFMELLGFLNPMMENNQITLKTKFDATNSKIYSEKELLKQVFHNLLVNGIQSMLEAGTLSVTTRNIESSNPKLVKRFQKQPSHPSNNVSLVEVSIQDTGGGMSEEVRSKIFDPFFTTKEQGTGLGLAIVHSIIESHSALINVESQPGKGTEVSILFPVITE